MSRETRWLVGALLLAAVVYALWLPPSLGWSGSSDRAVGGSAGDNAHPSASPAGPVATSPHFVQVLGSSHAWWNGSVTEAVATPLDALEASSRLAGFSVEVTHTASFGSDCHGVYVKAVGDDRERGAGGWNYYVDHDGSGWQWIGESSACYPLAAGDAVQWRWVEGGP